MLAEILDPPRDRLADLSDLIDDLQSEDLHLGAGAGLGPRLHTLYRAVNRLQAETARTLEAFDRSEAYRADGALSARVCRPHHRLVHEDGWQLERAADGGLIAIPP